MTDPMEGKLFFINAYLDEIDARIDNLATLAKAGFAAEALILCLVYIDGLASRLSWPAEKNAENFVMALCTYAGDSELGLVHPLQLNRALGAMSAATWGPIRAAVNASFPNPPYQLLTREEIFSTIGDGLTARQRGQLEKEIWRGTIAAVAYYSMRNAAVHALGASNHSFSNTTNGGEPALSLDLPRLQSAARDLAEELRRRSEATGEWFGNDAILG